MKKIFTFCVSLLAALSVFAYDFQSGDLFYNITSSSAPYTVEVTQQSQYYNSNYSGVDTIVIPETVTYNAIIYSVTSIGESAFDHSKLTTITIPNTVTSIGEYAFAYCQKLTSVAIGSGVKTIHMAAFNNCSALRTITIPANVKEIYNQAFTGASISTIYMEGTTPPSLLQSKSDGSAFMIFSTTPTCYVPCSAVASYKASTKWKGAVREFVAEFPYIFTVGSANISLGTIAITQQPDCSTAAIFEAIPNTGCYFTQWSDGNTDNPRTLKVTQDTRLTASFASSTYVVNLIAGANGAVSGAGTYDHGTTATITAIPNDGYHFIQWSDGNTDNPRSIVVVEPISLTALFEENYTQEHCQIIYTSTDGDIVTPWVTYNFGADIVSNTYADGQGVITFDGPVTAIGDTAFYNCSDLTSIIIPDRVTTIGNQAFQNCNALSNVTFGNRVESIGKAAFNNCSALQTLTIPQSVQYIYNYAFLGTSISTVYINSTTPPTLNPDHEDPYLVFTTNAITTCHIPCGTLASYQASDWNTKSFVRSFVEDCETSIDPTWQILYTSTDGNIAHANPEAFNVNMVSNEYKNGLGVITFDGPITQIDSYAFYGSTVDSIILPNTITSIGHCAFYLSSLSSITIPESVQTIKSSAFSCCYSLKTLIIEEGVTAIENEAFYHCSSLTSINLPNSIISIGDLAFNDCNSLAFVYIGNNLKHLGENVFESNPSLTSITWNAISGPDSQWRFEPFSDVPVSSFTFGNDVVRIPDLLCSGLCEVTSIIIPNSVDSIGYGAFEGCYSLTSITIPNSVTNIGDNAFYACSSITSITIPENVAFIGANAFSECTSLESIIWNAIRCDGAPFYDLRSQIKSFTLGNTVEHIPDYLCYSMSSLLEISIPESVTSIGEQAFAWCTSLTSIEIPANIQTIGEKAFSSNSPIDTIYVRATTPPTLGTEVFFDGYYTPPLSLCYIPCGTLADYQSSDWVNQVSEFVEDGCIDPTWQITYTSTDGNIVTPYATDVFGANIVSNTYEDNQGVITFDGPVTSIGDYAFNNCTSLASITLCSGVTSIGDQAFRYCYSLASIIIPNSVTSIGWGAFRSCDNLTSIIIPNSVTSIGGSAFEDCDSLTSITIPESVTNIEDGAFKSCDNLTSITIPESVTSIGSSAFDNCESLTSITIPNSVTSIGDWAFFSCSSLSSVTIGNSVKNIGDYAFTSCKSLTSITIPNSVTSTGKGVFIGCSSLTSITIPNSVTSIGEETFYECTSLTSITIPNSVTSIGERAFYRCTSLISATIGSGVTLIDYVAFWACSSLTSITCEAKTPPTLGSSVFPSNLTTAYIPCGTKAVYEASKWGTYSITSFIEEDCPEPIDPTWQILYTSIDSTVVTPYKTGVFGANIVSNTYQDGQGVITFDGPVTSIGDSAFWECAELASIAIPGSVTTIGYQAFSHCNNLASVTIPSGVTNIEEAVLAGCPALSRIIVENGNPIYDSRDNCNAIVETATNTLIAGCKNTIIPNSVTTIGKSAFWYCSTLTSINIPSSVKTIAVRAFVFCPSLTSIKIPKSVTKIEHPILTGCNSATSIVVEEGNPNYDSRDNCNAIIETATNALLIGCQNTIIPNSVSHIREYAFAYSTYPSIVSKATTPPYVDGNAFLLRETPITVYIPCGTKSAYEASYWASQVGEFVEEGCAPIQMCGDDLYWEYADGVLIITGTGGMYDYAKDTDVPWYDVRGNIKTVILPDAMTKIGQNAFYKCINMTTINMPTSLTAIGEKAFAQDTRLACEIILPASMTTIATRAFFNCQAVTAFHLEATTPPTIPNDAFERTTAPIHVPCGYGHVYGKHTRWGMLNLEMCELLQDNVYYYPIDGHTARAVTYHSNPTDTLVIPSAVVIDGMPRTVTEVADFAFTDCDDLPAIYFSEGLEYIGERAFVRCYGLQGTIVLPATLETIGERAFSYCDNVEKYLIQAMTPPALGDGAFTCANHDALFYVSCEVMDDYKVATNWSSLKSRLRDACLNIYHYNTPLGTNGVYTTEDTLVASIYYRRQFTPYRWETLYLPFEVDRVTVLEDGVEFDLRPWNIITGGDYYLAKPDGMLNLEILFDFTDELESHTPYIIQFVYDYYRDKIITFYGKESWHKLSTSFEVLSSSAWMQIAGNTTMQDQLLEKPVYMLRSGLDFILQKTTTTLHPFECYVMPYATPSGTPARMNVRFRGDVPTAVESVKGNESHLTYTIDGYTLTVYPQGQAFSIYSLNGALIYSCEAGKEAVDCELNSGCYLLHAGAEAHKIML